MRYVELRIPEDEAEELLEEIKGSEAPMLVWLSSNLIVSLGQLDYEAASAEATECR